MADIKSGRGKLSSFEYVEPVVRIEKFTLGPWVVEEDWGIDRDINGHARGEEFIAGFNVSSRDSEVVSCEGISGGGNTERANAHLIAAAPELYEALQRLVNVSAEIAPDVQSASVFADARAALAKARGES